METPEDLQSWGFQYGVKNELYKPSPTQPRCPRLAGTISPRVFPPSSTSPEEEAGDGELSASPRPRLAWSTWLCHILGQGVPQVNQELP